MMIEQDLPSRIRFAGMLTGLASTWMGQHPNATASEFTEAIEGQVDRHFGNTILESDMRDILGAIITDLWRMYCHVRKL